MFFTIALMGIAGCSDPCDDVNCLNGGTCNDGTCVCPDGFSGEFCQTTDLCAAITCQNGGACLDGLCDCPDGFGGEFCEVSEPCEIITCENGGTCDSGVCDCLEGYTGTNCQTEIRSAFIGTYMPNNGCSSDCNSTDPVYIVTDPSNIMQVTITNLCNGYTLTGIVQADGVSIVIPDYVYLPSYSFSVRGTGELNGVGVSLNLESNGWTNGWGTTCNLILVRQ